MKKRSCRMTPEEKAMHEFAVKVRKMTDKQLYEFVNTYTDTRSSVQSFIERLEEQSGNGIGPATVKKIKEFAIRESFITGECV